MSSTVVAVRRPTVEYIEPTGGCHLYHVLVNEEMVDEQRTKFVELIRQCDDVVTASYIADSENYFAVVYTRPQSMGLNKLMYTAWKQLKKLGF